jgi:hypothetical protein
VAASNASGVTFSALNRPLCASEAKYDDSGSGNSAVLEAVQLAQMRTGPLKTAVTPNTRGGSRVR